MTQITNTLEGFVELWQLLNDTHEQFVVEHRRFCVRRILHKWMPLRATDRFIWEVCWEASDWNGVNNHIHEGMMILGMDILPNPATHPRRCREFLRALTQIRLKLPHRQVDTRALDHAYSIVFPHSRALDVNKHHPP